MSTDITLNVQEITSLDDHKLLSFLDLYQTNFHITEQVKVSKIIDLLQLKSLGKATEDYLVTGCDQDSNVIAMAWYYIGKNEVRDEKEEQSPAVLWYMAIAAEYRNRGYGSALYQNICERAFANGCPFVVLEVECEKIAAQRSKKAVEECRRRNIFYRQRNGAFRLDGIQYIQSVDWQPAVEMDLLVQLNPKSNQLSAEQVFRQSLPIFGDSLQKIKTGTLGLLTYEGD